jgi:hypothetical protein
MVIHKNEIYMNFSFIQTNLHDIEFTIEEHCNQVIYIFKYLLYK